MLLDHDVQAGIVSTIRAAATAGVADGHETGASCGDRHRLMDRLDGSTTSTISLARTVQHIWLTAIAVAIGFVISFGLAILAVRRRSTYGPILGITDILYTIPSLALFAALVSITGITLLTVEIPLVMYTLRHLRAQHRRRASTASPSTCSRPPTAWASRARSACGGRDTAGRAADRRRPAPRDASRRSGWSPSPSILGDTFGGLGFFILEGYRRSFPTELYFGAIPSILLAIVLDVLLHPRPAPGDAVVAPATAAAHADGRGLAWTSSRRPSRG